MQIFDIVEELEKERKKNKELEEKISIAIAYIIAGKTFETKEEEHAVEYVQNDLLNILKGSDNNE